MGIMVGAKPCGTVVLFDELYGSESLTQGKFTHKKCPALSKLMSSQTRVTLEDLFQINVEEEKIFQCYSCQ